MILLDAYAVLALARGERASDEVDEIVRTQPVAMTAANLFETTDRLVRLYGWSPAEASKNFGQLVGRPIRIVPLDEDIAWRGALLRARHYDRQACDLSLADCVLLASANSDDAIATADLAVAAVARAEGIGLIPLPDSSGQRP